MCLRMQLSTGIVQGQLGLGCESNHEKAYQNLISKKTDSLDVSPSITWT